jgi:ABC-type multidrug transport system ATPase subunit
MDAIVAERLRKRYKTVQALDGVTFSVREGEVFGLLGPNGAGKSTTVRVLTTLTRADKAPSYAGASPRCSSSSGSPTPPTASSAATPAG